MDNLVRTSPPVPETSQFRTASICGLRKRRIMTTTTRCLRISRRLSGSRPKSLVVQPSPVLLGRFFLLAMDPRVILFVNTVQRAMLLASSLRMFRLKHLWLYVQKELHALACRLVLLTLDTSGCIRVSRASSRRFRCCLCPNMNVICEP